MALVKEADVDFVVANDISKAEGDSRSITIFDRKGRSETFEGSKALAAERVWRAKPPGVPGGGALPPARAPVLRGPPGVGSPGETASARRTVAEPPPALRRPGTRPRPPR